MKSQEIKGWFGNIIIRAMLIPKEQGEIQNDPNIIVCLGMGKISNKFLELTQKTYCISLSLNFAGLCWQQYGTCDQI